MSLVRWSAFDKERHSLRERMNQLFGEMVDSERASEMSAWSPSVNVYDKNGSIMVEAELPGVDKKDIKVRVDNGVLTLSGERKQEKEIKDQDFYRCERFYGSFNRSFTLPTSVEPDKIEAKYSDGILTLTVPKTETAKGKQVEIQ